jgi:uncharacterized membrane protein
MGYGSLPQVRYEAALAVACSWCVLTFVLVRHWTSASGWGDRQRFALVFGGVLSCILGGFFMFKIGGALRIDWIGKTVVDVAAIVWLLLVGHRLDRTTV